MDDPRLLGITELIDRGNTSFAGSIAEKKHNIQLAAQRLNGVVVAPGATFSFNDSVDTLHCVLHSISER